MVSFLKFVLSTLHVWEMGGNCVMPLVSAETLTHEIFSLGTFTFGHDRYCFALADPFALVGHQLESYHDTSSSVSFSSASHNGSLHQLDQKISPQAQAQAQQHQQPMILFRHNIWPLTVMVEMIVCAVILGYMWSRFLGQDREYLFELNSPGCILRAMTELMRTRSKVEVVRFRGGDFDVVNRSNELFHTIGSLPLVWKFSMDNYNQIPVQVLTSLLKGSGEKEEPQAQAPQTMIPPSKQKPTAGKKRIQVVNATTTTTSYPQQKGASSSSSPPPPPPSSSSSSSSTTTTRSSTSKLESLELHVEELIMERPSHLTDLCKQLSSGIGGASSLRHVKLYFWRHTEGEQTIRNEKTLVSLLNALQHHPTLQELEIKAPMGTFPMTTTTLASSSTSSSGSNYNNTHRQHKQRTSFSSSNHNATTPVVDALIAVVQTCTNLKRLRLNLWCRRGRTNNRPHGGGGGGGRGGNEPEEQQQQQQQQEQPASSSSSAAEVVAGDQDTWYVAALAKAMSHPSFYTKSNLQSLELLFASPGPPKEQGDIFVQSLMSLERMVRCNYNITHLFVGPTPHDEEYGDAYDYDNMLYHRDDRVCCSNYSPHVVRLLNSTRLCVTLNRLGRKRLLSDPTTTRKDWIEAILQDRDNTSITYSWISMYPAVLPLGSENDIPSFGLNHEIWQVDTGGLPMIDQNSIGSFCEYPLD